MLTTKEAAAFLGVALPTVQKWIQNGQIQAKRMGQKKWLLSRESLSSQLERFGTKAVSAFLTVEQAARRYQVSKLSLLAAIKEGELPFQTLGDGRKTTASETVQLRISIKGGWPATPAAPPLHNARIRGPKGRGTQPCSRRPRPEGAGRRGIIFRGLGPRPQGREAAFAAKAGPKPCYPLGVRLAWHSGIFRGEAPGTGLSAMVLRLGEPWFRALSFACHHGRVRTL